MGLRFQIVSTILIGVGVATSNPKPLNLDPEANQQSRASTSFRSWIFSHGSMDSFGMR
jgi:hypothetical protein